MQYYKNGLVRDVLTSKLYPCILKLQYMSYSVSVSLHVCHVDVCSYICEVTLLSPICASFYLSRKVKGSVYDVNSAEALCLTVIVLYLDKS